MVAYTKYGIGHNIVAFQIQYGLHKQLPCKRLEAHGNETTYLNRQYLLKNATHQHVCHATCLICISIASRNTTM
jgi:hypothetical protein